MGTPAHFDEQAVRRVARVLRGLGCLDLLALLTVVLPRPWIELAHEWAGLGALPEGPVVGYLIRSASALYALHGAAAVYLSFDVVRYWGLIRFLGLAALIHGAVMLGIGINEGMPLWWQCVEGPAFSATGAVMLFLQWRAGGRGDGAKPAPG